MEGLDYYDIIGQYKLFITILMQSKHILQLEEDVD